MAENEVNGADEGDAVTLEDVSDEEKERLRFEAELEFVQCLANPKYLNHLAQNLFLEDPAFLGYLEYLRYWKEPQYAKFVTFPHCLYILDLLQDKGFRERLKDPKVAEYIHVQQFYHWQYFQTDALESSPTNLEERVEEEEAAQAMDLN